MEYEIKPKNKFSIGLRELWEFKELFFFFTWRDIKIKYKQTVLGFLWAILQPLIMMLVFTTLLSGAFAKNADITIPYPLFTLSGLIVWGVFSSGVTNAANSMVNNSNIIKKIYFPRLIIPFSAILGSCFDFLMSLIVLIAMFFVYKAKIDIMALVYVPLALIMAALSAAGIGTFLAALNVKYRDIRYVIPFLIQALLFLTPVFYPLSVTQNENIRFILNCNPAVGPIELFRGIFSDYAIHWNIVGISSISSLLFLILGIFVFRKTEAFFADLA